MNKQIAIDWDKYMTGLSGKSNIDLDNISEKGLAVIKANGAPDTADYVIESKINEDGSWYKKYKSGWLEQGGELTPNDSNTHSFLRPFKLSPCIFIDGVTNHSGAESERTRSVTSLSVTSFSTYKVFYFGTRAYWYAYGQGA